MNITEKVAYIKGLIEGLDVDSKKPEMKIISAMVDLLDDMACSVDELEEGYDELADQLDAVDEDLCLLEEDFYEDEEECEDEEDDEDDLFYEVTCPTCNEEICVSEDLLLDDSMVCPNCGELLEFDLDDVCDENCMCHESDDCTCGDEPHLHCSCHPCDCE